MNSSTLLVILAVVVVCAVVFVLFSRSGKNKAAERKRLTLPKQTNMHWLHRTF